MALAQHSADMLETPPPQAIVLASSSPYRAELLGRLGLTFETRSPHIDETPGADESGNALATRLALTKASVIAEQCPGSVVIGSDQVADCRRQLLGKPGNRERAIEQLMFCSGAEILFHTALAVQRDDIVRSASVLTRVAMRSLDRAQIERYVDADQPYDCAGAMKSEAFGISLTTSISSDDPTALVGLPLTRVVALLGEFGVHLP